MSSPESRAAGLAGPPSRRRPIPPRNGGQQLLRVFLLRVRQDLLGAVACGTVGFLGALFSREQILLAALSGGEAVGNLLLAFFQRADQRRPLVD